MLLNCRRFSVEGNQHQVKPYFNYFSKRCKNSENSIFYANFSGVALKIRQIELNYWSNGWEKNLQPLSVNKYLIYQKCKLITPIKDFSAGLLSFTNYARQYYSTKVLSARTFLWVYFDLAITRRMHFHLLLVIGSAEHIFRVHIRLQLRDCDVLLQQPKEVSLDTAGSRNWTLQFCESHWNHSAFKRSIYQRSRETSGSGKRKFIVPIGGLLPN